MKISYYKPKSFLKDVAKLSQNQKLKLKARLKLFISEPHHPILRNHALEGKYKNYRSINIGGDLRLIYKKLSEDEILIITVGTHSQLYK
ncbi:MAG TPA: type II toxin-antitoxin system mRNA interferase toxin, RelE/StbE family [Candidatus Saccharibacteria bacterium]|jgi:addiction module RelE/StbE family toxin|nr:type II toxin-antitoxin system mRNA interferase toxin, RelE/StbE family [Candidatus Saccharibacteria bacterium]